jgi:hypothetical protein
MYDNTPSQVVALLFLLYLFYHVWGYKLVMYARLQYYSKQSVDKVIVSDDIIDKFKDL